MHHRLTRYLPYTPGQLFDLVADVERYPDFVRWVTALHAGSRRELADGVSVLDAEARVKFSIIRERFSTRVRLDRPGLAIDVDLISGPFRRLQNRWRFKPHGEGAQLDFEIDFEFGSRLLQALLAANFERAAGRLMGCFEQRAEALFGRQARA